MDQYKRYPGDTRGLPSVAWNKMVETIRPRSSSTIRLGMSSGLSRIQPFALGEPGVTQIPLGQRESEVGIWTFDTDKQAWYSIGCVPVSRLLGKDPWTASVRKEGKKVWFFPEMFTSGVAHKPTDLPEWFTCGWDEAAGRWVVLGPLERRVELAIADGTITAGSSGTADIWDGYEASPVDTGVSVTVYHNWMDGGQDISDGKKMIIKQFGDIWRVIAVECEPDEEPATKIGSGTSLPSSPTTYSLFYLLDGSGGYTLYENDGSGNLSSVSIVAPPL